VTATKQTTIWCDLCSCWDQASATEAQLRRELKAKGWTSFRSYYTNDFCPKCSAAKAEVLAELKALSPQKRSEFLLNR
jgi:hypothetical protein